MRTIQIITFPADVFWERHATLGVDLGVGFGKFGQALLIT